MKRKRRIAIKSNDIDPQASPADVLARIAGHPPPPATSTNCCRRIGGQDRPRAARLSDHGGDPAQPGRQTIAATSTGFTIGYFADLLGDGCLWLYGSGETGIPAFTHASIDNLRQISADE